MIDYTRVTGPVLPELGARIAMCPEKLGHREVIRLRVIEARGAKTWTAVVPSRRIAEDFAIREGWRLDETGEACA